MCVDLSLGFLYTHFIWFLTFEIMAKSVYSTKLIGDTHSNMIINVFSKLKFWCFIHTRRMLWFSLWKKSPMFKIIRISKFCYILYILYKLILHIFCLKYVQLSFWGFFYFKEVAQVPVQFPWFKWCQYWKLEFNILANHTIWILACISRILYVSVMQII